MLLLRSLRESRLGTRNDQVISGQALRSVAGPAKPRRLLATFVGSVMIVGTKAANNPTFCANSGQPADARPCFGPNSGRLIEGFRSLAEGLPFGSLNVFQTLTRASGAYVSAHND